MQEHEKPSTQDLLALKAEVRTRWDKLPPEHQASMVLTLVGDVMNGAWGSWLQDAMALTYPAPEPETRDPASDDRTQERYTAFGLTYTENLYGRVGHQRLLRLLQAEETLIHEAQVSSNNYGEFLFITASHPKGNTREVLGFWGLGYHDRRDRYLLEDWNWYPSSLRPKNDELIAKDALLALIGTRRHELQAEARGHTQSTRGKFYDDLADLTDEDGAATEMDDLGEMLDDLLEE